MWEIIISNPFYREVFAKAMLVFIPICLVLIGIMLLRVLRQILRTIYEYIKEKVR